MEFEVGRTYGNAAVPPLTVVRRTFSTVTYRYDGRTFTHRIRFYEDGSEYMRFASGWTYDVLRADEEVA